MFRCEAVWVCLRRINCENFSHNETVSLLCEPFWCFVKLVELENFFLQISQWNVFSPVWILLWSVKLFDCPNFFGHMSHWWGFSPEWSLLWDERLPFKVIFGELRELYLNYAWKNSSSTLKMARTCIFLIAIIFFDLWCIFFKGNNII